MSTKDKLLLILILYAGSPSTNRTITIHSKQYVYYSETMALSGKFEDIATKEGFKRDSLL